jgi:hypothetical protein
MKMIPRLNPGRVLWALTATALSVGPRSALAQPQSYSWGVVAEIPGAGTTFQGEGTSGTIRETQFGEAGLQTSLVAMGFEGIAVAYPAYSQADTVVTIRTGETVRLPDLSDTYLLSAPPDSNVDSLAARLMSSGIARYAEPRPVVHFEDAFPLDSLFGAGQQWGLDNFGQLGGVAHADVGAVRAWDLDTGGSEVLMAILDAGVTGLHPDLADRVVGSSFLLPVDRDWAHNNYSDSLTAGHGFLVAGVAGATACAGGDFDNTLKLGIAGSGSNGPTPAAMGDWYDADGLPTADGVTLQARVGTPDLPARLTLASLGAAPLGDGALGFRIGLPRAGAVSIRVFDVQGRFVRTLADGRMTAGWHELKWDAATAAGRKAANGMYFVRARWEGKTATNKIVLVR